MLGVGKKTSKNCQSVQCPVVKKIVSKLWLVGYLNFCLNITKKYQKKIRILFHDGKNIQKLSECTVSRDKK